MTFSGNLGTHTDCVQATRPDLTPAVCTAGTGTATSAYITLASTLHLSYTVDSSSTVYGPGATVELTPNMAGPAFAALSAYLADGTEPEKFIITESKLYTPADNPQGEYDTRKGLGY